MFDSRTYSQVHFPVEGFLANGSAIGAAAAGAGASDFFARSPKPENVEDGAAAARPDEEGEEAS